MPGGIRRLFSDDSVREVQNINPYLTDHDISFVRAEKKARVSSVAMEYGVYYSKSAGLMLNAEEKARLLHSGFPSEQIRRFIGSTEYINGRERYCLWIDDGQLENARQFPAVRERIDSVRRDRTETEDEAVNKLASRPHQFRERKGDEQLKIFVPIVSSENREYFPAGVVDGSVIATNKAFYIPNGPLWALAIITTKLHLSWIEAVCGRLEMRLSYSNTLGWNTFPLPTLTEKNKLDLTSSAMGILLAREQHFPATIADLYDPDNMPADLRAAHELNDDVLERIYIGRRFKNDTERLEKLFEMYTKMTADPASIKTKKAKASA
jgi:hypothetical protein